MKYIVKTTEDQVWTTWYVVEANSADEAKEICYEGEIYDEEYNYTDSHEVLEIEPYNED